MQNHIVHSSPERVDTFDENFHFVGAMTRERAHAQGAWHQAVHCWIVNPAATPTLLFQLRSPRTNFFPNRLDITAAGHVSAGETKAAVLREIEEELRVVPSYDSLVSLGVKIDVGKCGEVINREFAHVFLWERPESLRGYSPNPVEVAGLFEISLREGARLFAGETRGVEAVGMVWHSDSGSWKDERRMVSVDDFVPRIDQYYLRVLVIAERALRGEKYLAI